MLWIAVSTALAGVEDQVMVNAYGAELSWAAGTIAFEVDPANEVGLAESGAVAATVGAAGAWNTPADSAVDLRFQGTEGGLAGGYDDRNVVYFEHDWDSSPDLLAVTATWSNQHGEILDFDMSVNTEDHAWTLDGSDESTDLQNTLAHEFGHALGIAHNEHDDVATMFPVAVPGELLKRDLDASDRAVAAYLYPSGVDDAEADTGGLGPRTMPIGCASAAHPAGGAVAVPLSVLLVALSRRKEAACS